MLTVASANRFDDQRTTAPKPLSQMNEPPPECQFSIQGAPLDENQDPTSHQSFPPSTKNKKDTGFKVNHLPPSLAMSMPDLFSGEMESRLRNNSITHIPTKRPSGLRMHPEVSPSHGSTHRLQEQRSTSFDEPTSEPLRRRIIHREAQLAGEDSSYSPTASLGHCTSPLATTMYAYRKGSRGSSEGGRADSSNGSELMMNPVHSPIEEKIRESEEKEEIVGRERDSPDRKYPPEIQIGDSGLQRQTYPSGAGVRRHHSARTPPSDHRGRGYQKTYTARYGGSEEGGGGVREGWTTDSAARDVSPELQRTSAPLVGEKLHPRKPLSKADRSHSLDKILETEEAKSSHILLDAGLGFLSPHSPIVQGVVRRGSFTGGSPRLGRRMKIQKTLFNEDHEM